MPSPTTEPSPIPTPWVHTNPVSAPRWPGAALRALLVLATLLATLLLRSRDIVAEQLSTCDLYSGPSSSLFVAHFRADDNNRTQHPQHSQCLLQQMELPPRRPRSRRTRAARPRSAAASSRARPWARWGAPRPRRAAARAPRARVSDQRRARVFARGRRARRVVSRAFGLAGARARSRRAYLSVCRCASLSLSRRARSRPSAPALRRAA